MDDNYVITCLVGIIIGMFLGAAILTFVPEGLKEQEIKIKELGQSICEEEYNMDFDSYKDKSLKCKPLIKEEKYDGIVVEIGG